MLIEQIVVLHLELHILLLGSFILVTLEDVDIDVGHLVLIDVVLVH